MSSVTGLKGVLRGLQKVNRALVQHQQNQLESIWKNSSFRPVLTACSYSFEEAVSAVLAGQMPTSCESCRRSESMYQTEASHVRSAATGTAGSHVSPGLSTTQTSRAFHSCSAASFQSGSKMQKNASLAANSSGESAAHNTTGSNAAKSEKLVGLDKVSVSSDHNSTRAVKRGNRAELSKQSRERRVPGTKVERLVSFGSLGAGLAIGAVAEAAKRSFGLVNLSESKSGILDKSILLSEANANRIVDTLCRVRGAALKLGQMLSIQDNSLINPQLQQIFERVRQSADFMPIKQMEKVLSKDFGANWREKFSSFEMKPFAAASIGQVHKAVLHDGRQVAVKIQYPGVADSINNDIDNLVALLKVYQILPPGLYADKALKVARRELLWECDYIREAKCSERFRNFLKDDPVFYVPEVVWDLTTKNVLTTELVSGEPLDKLESCDDQDLKNMVCAKMLELCLNEVFRFNFMQTDPNWANFLFDAGSKRIMLLDFGSSREYSRKFTDVYIQIIKSASLLDRLGVTENSLKLGFLTGHETQAIINAHVDAVMILGEAFAEDTVFDFGQQSTARRIHNLIPVMLKHRLTPPPEETYSLHRKMAGCFLLCAKLDAHINCKPMFDAVWADYVQKTVAVSTPPESI